MPYRLMSKVRSTRFGSALLEIKAQKTTRKQPAFRYRRSASEGAASTRASRFASSRCAIGVHYLTFNCRAARLETILEQRKVHPKVLEHCRAEILQNNYFHAVLEAMKSITVRIRGLSGLDGDGAQLVDAAFGGGSPRLRINAFDAKSLQGEQRGFVSLLKGLYGMVRNPVAHEARIEWEMSEQDAVDVLTTISLVQRKLDNAKTGESSV